MPWLQLILESDARNAERYADILGDLEASAVTMQDAADQPLYEPPPGATPVWDRTHVVALYPAEVDIDAVLAALAERLAPEVLPDYRLSPLEDKDWTRAWMDAFEPMRFGERLWIVPSWHQAPDPKGVNILLDPGLAFGTGTHPTTRLCLGWLDGHPTTGQTVIDYGCGSGILAIAAALLGAGSVHGVDNDPQALLASRDNAERNDVSERLELYLPEAFPEIQAELLLANILAGPLVSLAPKLAGHVKPGGHIVLSGILPEQADQVREAYLPWFEMAAPVEDDGWIRLEGVKLPA